MNKIIMKILLKPGELTIWTSHSAGHDANVRNNAAPTRRLFKMRHIES